MIFLSKPEHVVLPSEQLILKFRMKWVVMAKYVARSTLTLAVLIALEALLSRAGDAIWALQTLLWYISIGVICELAYRMAHWWHETVIVTDKRFMKISGVFTERVDLMPVKKVTDLTYRRPFMGIVMDYGTLRIESAGQMQSLEYIDFVPDPERVYAVICELLFGEDDGERSHALLQPREPRGFMPSWLHGGRRRVRSSQRDDADDDDGT